MSGNLSDAVIRWRVLEWSRGLGPIHAYVGRTSRGWAEKLPFTDDEIVYPANRRRQWPKKLIFDGGHKTLIFEPGEVLLGAAHLKSEVVFLGVVLAVRARGGIVFRPPRADLHTVLGNQTMGQVSQSNRQQSLATAIALNIVVSSQVGEDELRSGEIAAALSRDVAHHEGWGSLSDLHQERRVRELCTRCEPVVTDRLPLASRVCRLMSLARDPPKSSPS